MSCLWEATLTQMQPLLAASWVLCMVNSGFSRYMKEPMLARDSNSPGIPTPDFLTTSMLPKVCRQLYEFAAQRAGMNAVPVSHAAITPGVFNCGSCFMPSVRRVTRNAAS